MRYCGQCGTKCDINDCFCTQCGSKLEVLDSNTNYNTVDNSQKMNIMCVVGFVCSFIFVILGLILSIVGLNQVKKTGEDGKAFAVAGIVISSLKLAILLFFLIIFYFMIFSYL